MANWANTALRLQDVDHLIVIGSDRMMAAVKDARFGVLKRRLRSRYSAGSSAF